MEQKNFNKKLQQREIKPSEGSWKKLDEKLTAFEHKKRRNKLDFLKYAAAILLLISVGFYFNQEEAKTDVIIVEEPVIKLKELKRDLLEVAPEEVLVEVSKEEKIKQPKIKSILVKPTKLHVKQEIVDNNKLKKEKEQLVVEAQISNLKVDSIQAKKIEEYIVLAQSIKKNKGDVSDLEIERLLYQAHKSLKEERIYNKKQIFRGEDLLAEIEYDLDKDFKAKLFEAIVNTLKDPKKVFVNRDN